MGARTARKHPESDAEEGKILAAGLINSDGDPSTPLESHGPSLSGGLLAHRMGCNSVIIAVCFSSRIVPGKGR